MNKHVNIPIFIPEAACPNRCIYCNQFKITGSVHIPSIKEVQHTIELYLTSIDIEKTNVEVAFFGGNFTGLHIKEQISYFEVVKPYFEKGIQGIRISTRPDYINEENARILKDFRVVEVELGIQSSNQFVLNSCNRGYELKDIEKSIEILKRFELPFGMQMMVGLPSGNLQNELQTAQDISDWGAISTRIYPLILIEDTPLMDLANKGMYYPLSLTDAIERVKHLYLHFEKHNIRVLRMGLHSSDNISILSEPFHPAFGQLVKTAIWEDVLSPYWAGEQTKNSQSIIVKVAPKEKVYAIGYQSVNLKRLQQKFQKATIVADENMDERNYHVDIN